jgi:hypothetical protein
MSCYVSLDQLNEILANYQLKLNGCNELPLAQNETVARCSEMNEAITNAFNQATSSSGGDQSRVANLEVARLDIAAGSGINSNFDITSATDVAGFVTFDVANNTITFASHTKDIIVDFTINAYFAAIGGTADGLDSHIVLKNTVTGVSRCIVGSQGGDENTNVQATGRGLMTITPTDINRTYSITVITQSNRTWRVQGLFASAPSVSIKVTKT